MYFVDFWKLAHGLGYDVPAEPASRNATIGQEQLMRLAADLRDIGGEEALKRTPLIVAENTEIQEEMKQEFLTHEFYGLHPSRVLFIPSALLPGFGLDAHGAVVLDPQAEARPSNHGYTVMEMNEPGTAYTLDSSGRVRPLAQ